MLQPLPKMMADFLTKHKVVILKDSENKAPQYDASEELEVSCTNKVTLR